MRVECRVAGGDANPYLAFSALIAAGLAGIDGDYELEPAWEGSGYDAHDRPHVPAHAARGDGAARRLGARTRGVRRRGRRALPARRPRRAGAVRPRRSPTGSCSGASSACRWRRPADRARARTGPSARWTYWELPVALVPAGYIEGVRLAGGLPLRAAADARGRAPSRARCSTRSTGCCLIGGPDLGVDLYGSPPAHPETGAKQERRDAFELALLRRGAAARAARCSASAAACSCSTSPPAATSSSTSPTRPTSRRTARRPACSDGIRSRSSRARGRPTLLGVDRRRCTRPTTRASGAWGRGSSSRLARPTARSRRSRIPRSRSVSACSGIPRRIREGAGAPLFRGLVEAARRYARRAANTGRTARGREAARPVQVRRARCGAAVAGRREGCRPASTAASPGREAPADCRACPSHEPGRAAEPAVARSVRAARGRRSCRRRSRSRTRAEARSAEAAAALRLLRLLDRREHVLQGDALRLGDRVEPVARGKSLGEVGRRQLQHARGRVDDGRTRARPAWSAPRAPRRPVPSSARRPRRPDRGAPWPRRSRRRGCRRATCRRRSRSSARSGSAAKVSWSAVLVAVSRKLRSGAAESCRPGEPARAAESAVRRRWVVVVGGRSPWCRSSWSSRCPAPRELLAAATAPPPASAATASPQPDPGNVSWMSSLRVAGCLSQRARESSLVHPPFAFVRDLRRSFLRIHAPAGRARGRPARVPSEPCSGKASSGSSARATWPRRWSTAGCAPTRRARRASS